MKQLTYSFLLLLTVSTTVGCTSLQDCVVDTEVSLRNKVLAQHAWNNWSWCYEDLDHPFHFAKGFKAGYRNILDGGNGCQPTLPPRCYWKPCFQTPEGQCKIHAWFDGFSHGALAAKQDGHGNLSQIPISPTARMNLRMANAPAPPTGSFGNASYQSSPPPIKEMSPPPVPVLPDAELDPEGPVPAEQAVPLRPYE
jgi:hypothetical protein